MNNISAWTPCEVLVTLNTPSPVVPVDTWVKGEYVSMTAKGHLVRLVTPGRTPDSVVGGFLAVIVDDHQLRSPRK